MCFITVRDHSKTYFTRVKLLVVGTLYRMKNKIEKNLATNAFYLLFTVVAMENLLTAAEAFYLISPRKRNHSRHDL